MFVNLDPNTDDLMIDFTGYLYLLSIRNSFDNNIRFD